MTGPAAAFRADASARIGLGHVMRCLTLADALAAKGWRCSFLMRRLDGRPPDSLITGRGHALHLLPEPGAGATGDWLGVTPDRDRQESAAALDTIAPDWVIVDHYGLDAGWERGLAAPGRRILVLDDLADRPHACDLLLDQTFGRAAGDYAGLVADGTRLLLGAGYALLRPEFAALRPEALRARRQRLEAGLRPLRILVAPGGYDAPNVTTRVIEALAQRPAGAPPVAVDIVLGGQALHLPALRARLAAPLPFPAQLHLDTPDMARLMAAADLAIGAGGTTTWERACLGLPCLLIVLADNQREIAARMQAAGAARVLADPAAPGFEADLIAAIDAVATPAALARASAAAARIVDGAGTGRARDALAAAALTCRRATAADSRAVWAWRHVGGANRFYANPAPVPFPGHDTWFRAALAAGTRSLLIAEDAAGTPIAHLRLDPDGQEGAAASVSIVLAPEARGRGLAGPALRCAIWAAEDQGLLLLRAEVHEQNAPSLHLFRVAGFEEVAPEAPFRHFELRLPRAAAEPRTP